MWAHPVPSSQSLRVCWMCFQLNVWNAVCCYCRLNIIQHEIHHLMFPQCNYQALTVMSSFYILTFHCCRFNLHFINHKSVFQLWRLSLWIKRERCHGRVIFDLKSVIIDVVCSSWCPVSSCTDVSFIMTACGEMFDGLQVVISFFTTTQWVATRPDWT